MRLMSADSKFDIIMSSYSTQIKEHFDTNTKAVAHSDQKLKVFENWRIEISKVKLSYD